MIQIRLEGNWNGVANKLGSLPHVVRNAALAGEKKAANQLVKIVKKHINEQDLGWVPRAEGSRENDPRILVDTATYLKSIQAWKPGNSNSYFVGVPKSKYNQRGVRVADYAVYHEFGFGNVPARPLWGPSFEELGGAKGVQKIIIETLLARLGKW